MEEDRRIEYKQKTVIHVYDNVIMKPLILYANLNYKRKEKMCCVIGDSVECLCLHPGSSMTI